MALLLPHLLEELSPLNYLSLSLKRDPLMDQDIGSHQFIKNLQQFDDSFSNVSTESDDFQASIDVQQFKPEEITVKIGEDRVITVEAKHEERQDEHGFISRHFVRKYALPKEFDVEKVKPKLSSDGVLHITAPKKVEGKQIQYKEIPITLTGPVRGLKHKLDNKKIKQKRLVKKGSRGSFK